MRKPVFLICAGYVVLFAVMWLFTVTDSGLDAMGRGMALGFQMIGMAVTAIFAIPALILAARDKAPNWALGLAIAPAFLALLLVVNGLA